MKTNQLTWTLVTHNAALPLERFPPRWVLLIRTLGETGNGKPLLASWPLWQFGSPNQPKDWLIRNSRCVFKGRTNMTNFQLMGQVINRFACREELKRMLGCYGSLRKILGESREKCIERDSGPNGWFTLKCYSFQSALSVSLTTIVVLISGRYGRACAVYC